MKKKNNNSNPVLKRPQDFFSAWLRSKFETLQDNNLTFYKNVLILALFVFNWGGIKPRWTPDKEVWPNPISVSIGD